MTEHRILGRGVRLRPLRREDLPKRLDMINDPEVQRLWIGVPADQNTLEDLEIWFYLVNQDPYSEQWAIEAPDGRYIGDIDLYSINQARKEAAMSVMLGDKAYWPADARRDILVTALRYALEDKGLRRITMEVPDSDREGLQLLQELGFRVVDEYELDIFEGVNELTLELLAENFNP